MLKKIPNTPEQLTTVIEEIISTDTGNDFITFEIKDVAPIALAKKYAGIGVSIVANKVPGIRCAHCHDLYCAKYTRLHNDANMIAFGEKVLGEGMMQEIVSLFLNTEFEGGERHERRVAKIKVLEEKYSK